jgi:formylmethanofuran dehydrogenase subunit C
MSITKLRLRQLPQLRVDLRAVSPKAAATLGAQGLQNLGVGHGNKLEPLAEFFDIQHSASEQNELHFEGDLSRFDRIGWQMDGGHMHVQGHAGDYVGACMQSGSVVITGHAGLLAACEMAGGNLTVHGNVGDFAASTLPGSMDGMRGGQLTVHGHTGARLGDRMRRGCVWVMGDAVDFVASRMVAGTIAIGGRAGAHVGFGMRRGTVVFAGAAPTTPTTFVPTTADASVTWQLLARSLAQAGGPFAALSQRSMQRQLGDVAVGGRGELIIVT